MVLIENVFINPHIMNASGLGSVTKKQIEDLDKSFVGAIVSKTCTFDKRDGNPKPNYHFDDIGSINAIGVKNEGYKYYVNIETKKPYILSVVPDCRIFSDSDIYKPDLIEVNLSCPNIESFNYEESIRKISESCERKFGIKISPVLENIGEIVDLLSPKISFITCCNTMKNGLIIDESGKPYISNTFGGIGGSYIKPFCLSTVYRLSKETTLPIIGCGGISTELDIDNYIKCGASAVQVGTHYFKNGIKVFDELSK